MIAKKRHASQNLDGNWHAQQNQTSLFGFIQSFFMYIIFEKEIATVNVDIKKLGSFFMFIIFEKEIATVNVYIKKLGSLIHLPKD